MYLDRNLVLSILGTCFGLIIFKNVSSARRNQGENVEQLSWVPQLGLARKVDEGRAGGSKGEQCGVAQLGLSVRFSKGKCTK